MKTASLRLILLLVSVALNLGVVFAVRLDAQSCPRREKLAVRIAQTVPEVKKTEPEKPQPEKRVARSMPKTEPQPSKPYPHPETPATEENPAWPLGIPPAQEPGNEEGVAEETEGIGEPGEGSPATGPSEAEIERALADYRRSVYASIERHKQYPAIARRLGHTGKVKVSFALAREGTLTSVAVSSSSGYPELDEAALAAVRAVGKFPAFPDFIEQAKLDFTVRLVFELQ